MNRFKKIYILLGVLVAVCIAAIIVIQVEDHKEQIQNSEQIILELASDDIQSLSWEYDSVTLAFHKEDGQWLYDEDEAFPVDEAKINELLAQFESFGVSFIIEEVEDYGQYGLDDPVCTINLSTAEQTYQIILGNYSEMDSERYVSIGDGNVYLVADDPLNYFDLTISDLIDHDEIPVFDLVSEIQFAGVENYEIVYEEDSPDTYCADDIYFAQLNGNNLPLDTSLVNSYLNTISALNLNNYVTYNATAEELQSYGLDDPELTVTIDYTVENENGEELEETFVMHISRDPQERQAVEAAEDAGDGSAEETADEEEITAYVRIGDSQIIYQLSAYNYEQLMAASYDSLRHQEVFTADFDQVYQIDIALEDNEHTITAELDGEEYIYYYQDEEVDISSLQYALEALTAAEFTDEQPTQKMEISLILSFDNENYQQIEIELYRYDGTYCLAVLDGEPISLVERSYVVDLIEAVNAIVLN